MSEVADESAGIFIFPAKKKQKEKQKKGPLSRKEKKWKKKENKWKGNADLRREEDEAFKLAGKYYKTRTRIAREEGTMETKEKENMNMSRLR